jgi:glycosyltransferase involved in cell wall biosynthesis
MAKRRVLAVCMMDSIHSARWLAQFREQDIDFLLFPSSPHRRVHPELERLLSSSEAASFRLPPLARYFALPLWVLDKFAKNFFRGSLLKASIKSFQPSTVHSLELQNAGYLALRALSSWKPKGLKLLVTNWGSDIFWFQRFPKHKAKLQKLMKLADFYSAECERDVVLARSLGFAGLAMPVIPNAGGFSEADFAIPLLAPSERRTIALKGYHGWVGRAKVSLEAVREMSEELQGYKIIVYSANRSVLKLAKQISKQTGLEIKAFGKGTMSHKQVLEMFARSKIYVGLSESDGISTSMLEAMAMGAIPVQTSTACCDEWFGDSGVAVHEITVPAVKNAIREGLKLAENPANAERNLETIQARASAEMVKKIALTFYD